jgi:serine phosphatase RsbU (regulator of sigma subunit)
VSQLLKVVETNSDTSKYAAINMLATIYAYDEMKYDSALLLANFLIDPEKNPDEKYKGEAYATIGYSFFKQLKYYDALAYCLKAQEFYENFHPKNKYLLTVYQHIAVIHKELERFTESMNYQTKVLDLAKLHHDSSRILSTYANIANIYIKKNNYQEALNNYQSAETIINLTGDSTNIFSIVLGLAICENGLGNTDNVRRLYRKAGDLYNKENKWEDMKWKMNYADFELSNKNYIQAEIIYKNLSKDQTWKNHEQVKSYAFLGLAEAQLGLKKYTQVIKSVDKSLKFFDKNNIHRELIISLELKAKALEKLGRYKESNTIMNEILIAKDSFLLKTTNSKMKQQLAKLKFDEKEEEMKLLRIQNELNEAQVLSQKYKDNYWAAGMISLVMIILMVYTRYRTKQTVNNKLREKNKLIESQKLEIENEKNLTISSIHSALDVQELILPAKRDFDVFFNDSFIIYKPKDVVSGDFYWVFDAGVATIVAVADCTGHGVPGALTSMLGYNLLEKIVKEYGVVKPQFILNLLSREIARIINSKEKNMVPFGMEISLCSINKSKNRMEMASTHSSILILSEGKLHVHKPNNVSLGTLDYKKDEHYNQVETQLKKGDQIYLFSDGYVDQKGGEKGRKFYNKPLHELIASFGNKKMEDQKNILEKTLINWQGDLLQLDDITVLGIKV